MAMAMFIVLIPTFELSNLAPSFNAMPVMLMVASAGVRPCMPARAKGTPLSPTVMDMLPPVPVIVILGISLNPRSE
jgi:hypothetical protein